MNQSEILAYLDQGAKARLGIDINQIESLGVEISKRLMAGNKILLMGNGGSAADSQHIATEFVSRFECERKALRAISLTVDTSILTAISNDYSYEKVFERQIEAQADEGDIVIGISTSGNSKNVINAIKKANDMNCLTIAMTGQSGGYVANIAQHTIKVKSNKTSIIQEVHIAIGHIISKIAEDMIVGK